MDNEKHAVQFRKRLIDWYRQHKRDLPWRDTTDFYKVWISEIILQQTQVAQGLDYYLRFIERFPSVEKLAQAEEHEVLKLWQGLGYYTRAINLHKAAKQIMTDFGGRYPSTYKEILSLKGVGPYTAAAIASFVYQLPYAVVDGNVYRVLSRLYNEAIPVNTSAGKKYFETLAANLLDKENPDLYNQAIMEFGALQCRPQNPDCASCVFQQECKAYYYGTVDERPQKQKKGPNAVRYITYFVIETPKGYLLRKRNERQVFKNLYEFLPNEHEEPKSIKDELLLFEKHFFSLPQSVVIKQMSGYQKHVLSHIDIHYRYVCVNLSDVPNGKKYEVVPKEKLKKFPVHRIVEKIIEQL